VKLRLSILSIYLRLSILHFLKNEGQKGKIGLLNLGVGSSRRRVGRR
jgi:hypothetical protein